MYGTGYMLRNLKNLSLILIKLLPASVSHLRLVPVVGEKTILQDKPALLVTLDVVRPLVQPTLFNKHQLVSYVPDTHLSE
jgi:hypothetical protein